jgi:L-ascorbate metabolism protein UlaG (beta-lactamase superfamily)
MNPEQALQAFQDLRARTFVAMHWGTFKLTDEPLDEPPARLEAERVRRGLPSERVRVPAVGETIEVGRTGAVALDHTGAPL